MITQIFTYDNLSIGDRIMYHKQTKGFIFTSITV